MANGFLISSPTELHGSSTAGPYTNLTHAIRFVCPGSGLLNISEVGLFCRSENGDPEVFYLAIYDDDSVNNCPENLIARTPELTIAGTSWQKIAHFFTTPPQLNGGQIYWLAYHVDEDDITVNTAGSSGGTGVYRTATSYPSNPTPAEWHSHSDTSHDLGIYAVYSAASTTYDETGLSSTITGVTAITDLQQYQESVSTNINGITAAQDRQNYQETLQAIFSALAAVNDHQAYVESLGFVVQSVTTALDDLIQNLVETLAFTMSTQTQATDHQKYIEQLTTAFTGLTQTTDHQKYVESLTLVVSTITAIIDSLASSFSESLEFTIGASINGADHQNYIETLVSVIMTGTGLNEINHFVEQLHTVASMATTATERGHYIELLTDLWTVLSAVRTGFHPLGLPFFKYGFNADYMARSFEKQAVKKEFERFSQRHFNA